MQKFPTQVLKLRALCNIPLSDLADICPPQDLKNEKQRLSFLKLLRKSPSASECQAKFPSHLELNAAAWLGFPEAPDSPVSLWLCYKDKAGESAVLVDEQTLIRPGSAMLSGTVSLMFKGQVEYIKVCCGGLANSDRFSVDELYVKRERVLEDSVRRVS